MAAIGSTPVSPPAMLALVSWPSLGQSQVPVSSRSSCRHVITHIILALFHNPGSSLYVVAIVFSCM